MWKVAEQEDRKAPVMNLYIKSLWKLQGETHVMGVISQLQEPSERLLMGGGGLDVQKSNPEKPQKGRIALGLACNEHKYTNFYHILFI